jgi:hypothetical protein
VVYCGRLLKKGAGCVGTLRWLYVDAHPFGYVAGRRARGYAKFGSAAGRWPLDSTVFGLLALRIQRAQ